MSAIGLAKARGPEMWSDMGVPRSRFAASGGFGLVRGLVQHRLQGRVLQCLRGLRMVEYFLEGVVDSLSLPDLLHRAAVVACVGGRSLLRIMDERFQRSQVRKALVTLRVPEDDIEELERRT